MTWLSRLFSRGRIHSDLSTEMADHVQEKSKGLLPLTERETNAPCSPKRTALSIRSASPSR
jgi:hypothetical protein